jgi:cytochrome c peroxidase
VIRINVLDRVGGRNGSSMRGTLGPPSPTLHRKRGRQERAVTFIRRGLAPWLASLAVTAAITGVAAGPVGAEPITPLQPPATDPAKSDLGRRLFRDVRLSKSTAVACDACHALDSNGADDRRYSTGADGRFLDFNSPTVFNAALNYRLGWRGNFRTLDQQNEFVLLDSRLMSTSWEELLPKLRADQNYVRTFTRLYGSGPARAHVLDALATFQRSLVTPNARFDRYLNGQHEAITSEEQRGYQLFKSYGCIACHQGTNLGGNLLQSFGVFGDPFAHRGKVTEADLGRFAITGNETDRYVFRVPSLRNVAVTAPYFHDGSAASLSEAVETMARVQLGRDLPRPDIELIVKFLGTLTGEYQGRALTAGSGGSAR